MISFGGREARSLRNGEVAATGRFCRAVQTLLTIKGEVRRRGSLHTLMLGIVTASAPASCGSFHHIRRDTRCEFTDRTALLLVLPREAPGAPVRAAFRCSRTHNRHQTAAPRSRPRRRPTSMRCSLCKGSRRIRSSAASARCGAARARWTSLTTSRLGSCPALSTPRRWRGCAPPPPTSNPHPGTPAWTRCLRRLSCGSRLNWRRLVNFDATLPICLADRSCAEPAKAPGFPLGDDDDIVSPMAPLYKLRRGRTVSGALHGQMDWPWKS